MNQATTGGKRRVVLISDPILFSEGLQILLGNMEEVELMGPWEPAPGTLQNIAEEDPDVVMLVDGEPHSKVANTMITAILESYPSLPLIHLTLLENRLQVYTTYASPARKADLLEIIRQLPSNQRPAAP
jgi:DNA-binding NarL/FixJ family response regulator